MNLKLVVIIVAVLQSSNAFSAPSFNCAVASSVVEQAICHSENLSALDVKLNGAYKQRLSLNKSTPFEIAKIKSFQRKWLIYVSQICKGTYIEQCLSDVYTIRIKELENHEPYDQYHEFQQVLDDAEFKFQFSDFYQRELPDLEYCSFIGIRKWFPLFNGRVWPQRVGFGAICRTSSSHRLIEVCFPGAGAGASQEISEKDLSIKSIFDFTVAHCSSGA